MPFGFGRLFRKKNLREVHAAGEIRRINFPEDRLQRFHLSSLRRVSRRERPDILAGPDVRAMEDVLVPPARSLDRTFHVLVDGTRVRVRRPRNAEPGQKVTVLIEVTGEVEKAVPADAVPGRTHLRFVENDASDEGVCCPPDAEPGGKVRLLRFVVDGAVYYCPPPPPQSCDLWPVAGEQTIGVVVPPLIGSGRTFPVLVNGAEVRLRRPFGAHPGRKIHILVEVTGQVGLTVPPGVVPGRTLIRFAVGGAADTLRCPPDAKPGQKVRLLRFVLDGDIHHCAARAPADGSPLPPPPVATRPIHVRDNRRVAEVCAPPGVWPGRSFAFCVEGECYFVTCTCDTKPGQRVRVPFERARRGTWHSQPNMEVFEARVPAGIGPGGHFALFFGSRFLVQCPSNAKTGRKIRFSIPLPSRTRGCCCGAGAAWKNVWELNRFDEGNWRRSLRVADMKFQWLMMDDKSDIIPLPRQFDMKESAYIRKIEATEKAEARMSSGELSLLPANEVLSESHVPGAVDIITVADLLATEFVGGFEEKRGWFRDSCAKLSLDVNPTESDVTLKVRREDVLGDSIRAVMDLSCSDMQKKWKVEFVGEAGGADDSMREWLQLVTAEIFDPDFRLWRWNECGRMNIVPAAAANKLSEKASHVLFFRCLGRILGKAIFDGRQTAVRMVQPLYKYIFGWPMQFADLEYFDEKLYSTLSKLEEMVKKDGVEEDLRRMCPDFTIPRDNSDTDTIPESIELVPNGANVNVTKDNLPEYLEAVFKYKVLEQIWPQLTQLLLGIFDIISEPLLAVFNCRELETLVHGFPSIDVDYWRAHTEYSGEFALLGVEHPVCKWFWEIVSELDQEMRARYLFWITGEREVLVRGFCTETKKLWSFRRHGLGPKNGDVQPRSDPSSRSLEVPLC